MIIGVETLQRVAVIWTRRMTAPVTKFKANCLSLIARGRTRGGVISSTDRERAPARSLGDVDAEQKPWLLLRAHTARWQADPFAPAVDPDDVEASK